jgi:hypothetical protein
MQPINPQAFAMLNTEAESQSRNIRSTIRKAYRHRFSLIEVLMVMALMAMIFTMFMQFLQQGGSQVRAEAEQTEMYRQVAMLKKSFRKFVHTNGAIYSCSNKSVVFKNDNLISVEPERLIFKQEKHTNSLQFPRKCTASFSLEHHENEPDLLVLTIAQKPNPKLPGRLKSFIRLVASCTPANKPVKNSEVAKK